MPRHSARTSGAPSRYAGAAEKERSSGVERAATVAAALLGLGGYLYALGGIVLWLRVQTAQIPADGAIVVVDPRHLLAVGARVVAFEIFILLAVSAIVSAIVVLAVVRRGPLTRPSPRGRFGAIERGWGSRATLAGFIGPESALLLLTVGMSIQDSALLRTVLCVAGGLLGAVALLAMIFRVPPRENVKWRITFPPAWRSRLGERAEKLELESLRLVAGLLLPLAAGVAIFLLPILQGTILLAGTAMIYAGPIVRWPGTSDFGTFRRELLLSSGVWTAIAVATAIALAWVATPPVGFTRVDVSTAKPKVMTLGAFLARSDAGVYLGICDFAKDGEEMISRHSRIQLVPPEQSASLFLGPASYEFDPGGRPSIFMAAKEIVSGGSAGGGDAPLHHPLLGVARHPCNWRFQEQY